MSRTRLIQFTLGAVALIAVLMTLSLPAYSFWKPGMDMPEFTTADPGRWLNSKPLKKADLKGKVVLIEVWTSV